MGFFLSKRENRITRESKVTVLISQPYRDIRENIRHLAALELSIQYAFYFRNATREGGKGRRFPDRYILPFAQPLCIVRAYLDTQLSFIGG